MLHLLAIVDPTTINVTDKPGWGAAEWVALVSAVSIVVGTLTTAAVQLRRFRKENSSQHAEGRALVIDVRDRLLDVHESIHHVDEKVDKVAERLEDHERTHRGEAS